MSTSNFYDLILKKHYNMLQSLQKIMYYVTDKCFIYTLFLHVSVVHVYSGKNETIIIFYYECICKTLQLIVRKNCDNIL